MTKHFFRFFGIITLILAISAVNVSAFETDDFDITIPNGYSEQSTAGSYYWETENEDDPNIIIEVTKNFLKKNIKNATENDIENIENNIKLTNLKEVKSSIKNGKISDYHFKSEKSTVNEYAAVMVDDDFVCSSDEYEVTLYQRQWVFTSVNHNYNITLTSLKKDDLDSEKMQAFIKSFKIKDDLIQDNKNAFKNNRGSSFDFQNVFVNTLLGGIIGGIVGVIICLINKVKKRKQQRNKNN